MLGGIASTVAGVALAMSGAGALWRPTAPTSWFVPFAALPVVALFPFWLWSTGGLETGLGVRLVGPVHVDPGRWAADPARTIGVGSAVVLGLGWLVRPEMVLYSIGFLAVVLLGDRRVPGAYPWRGRCRGRAPVVYQIFRMGYYGSILANTAIAKEGLARRWDRGWRYLVDFDGAYALWVPVLIIVAGGYLPLGFVVRRCGARRSACWSPASSLRRRSCWGSGSSGSVATTSTHDSSCRSCSGCACRSWRCPSHGGSPRRCRWCRTPSSPCSRCDRTNSGDLSTIVLGGSPDSIGKVTLDDRGRVREDRSGVGTWAPATTSRPGPSVRASSW